MAPRLPSNAWCSIVWCSVGLLAAWLGLASAVWAQSSAEPVAPQPTAAVPDAASTPVSEPRPAPADGAEAAPSEAAPLEAAAAEAAPPEAAADEPALPAAAPSPDEPAPESAQGAEVPFVPAAPSVASSTDQLRAEFTARLTAVERERSRSSNILPWLVIATGASTAVLGVSVGAYNTFECESHCESPAWATLSVVVGVAILSAGTVWLVRANASIAELDRKQRTLKLDLDALDRARARAEGRSALSQAFSYRVAF